MCIEVMHWAPQGKHICWQLLNASSLPVYYKCISQCILRNEDLAARQYFWANFFCHPSSRAVHSEGLWLSTDISWHKNQLQVPCFANSCQQHICPDICKDWPKGTSWVPGRDSKLLRVRYFGIFLNLIGFEHPSIGAFYQGDRRGGEPWRTLDFDQGWRWCFSIQPWSRPQYMATPSTIFNGDLRPPPNWILSRVAWWQLKCVRTQQRKGHSTWSGMPQLMIMLGSSTYITQNALTYAYIRAFHITRKVLSYANVKAFHITWNAPSYADIRTFHPHYTECPNLC